MLKPNHVLIVTLPLLLANPSQDGLQRLRLASAQAFPTTVSSQPTVVPSATAPQVIQIAVSDVTDALGQKLQQGFAQRPANTLLNLTSTTTNAALQSVAAGRADIAIIARPLTAAEWRQGLVAQTIGRQKIAIIIKATNPFIGTLSNEQLAQIWNGKIRNWSMLGGPDRPIRVIDQTADSDTRRALARYAVFQSAVATPSQGAVPLKDNRLESIVAQLGNDGIAYVVLDQAQARSDLKMVSLYGVLPNDPRYAISQPLSYVYKGPKPDVAVKAFLDYATGSEGQALAQISTGNVPPTTAVKPASNLSDRPSSPQSSAQNRPTNFRNRPFPSSGPGLLLALIGVCLFGVWRQQQGRSASPSASAPAATPDAAATVAGIRPATMGRVGRAIALAPSRVILVPRNCHHAYAYWEINQKQRTQLQDDPRQTLKLRLYSTSPRQFRHLIQEYDCAADQPDCHIPIGVDHHDYYVELGYISSQGKWLRLAASAPVKVPACDAVMATTATPMLTRNEQPAKDPAESVTDRQPPAAPMAPFDQAVIAQRHRASKTVPDYRIHLVARGESAAYAYWGVVPSLVPVGAIVPPQYLRLYDVTDAVAHERSPAYQQFDCHPSMRDMHLAIPAPGRNYAVEIGYIDGTGQWIALARSLNTDVGNALTSKELK